MALNRQVRGVFICVGDQYGTICRFMAPLRKISLIVVGYLKASAPAPAHAVDVVLQT